MALIDSITIGEKLFCVIDADPTISGIEASLGSIATMDDGTCFFMKIGSLDTDWTELLLMNANGTITFTEAVINASEATTSAIDWINANSLYHTLSANTSFTFSNDANGQTIVLTVTQASSGGPYTATFPAGVQWSGGTEPTMTSTASRTDVYTFIKVNGIIYGSSIKNFS